MASRIITKKGSGAPLASDLVHGELAVDTVNKRLYTENAGGTVIEVGTSPSTIDINAGTIDGTVIGGSTAAAGTFTTFTSTGIDDNATSTAITIDASENVGIGTTSPSAKIHTVDLSGASGNTLPSNASAIFEAAANMGIAVSAPTAAAAGVYFPRATDAYYAGVERSDTNLLLRNNGTERMRIDASGNVGIGTTTPLSPLTVTSQAASNVSVRTTDSVFGSITGGTALDSLNASYAALTPFGIRGSTLTFGTSAGISAHIDASGNVGIGTGSITNPYSQSNFTNVNIDGVWGGVISFKLGGTEKGWIGQRSSGNSDMVVGASSGQNLLFATNGNNERARIDASGNLLVGKTTPTLTTAGHDLYSNGVAYHVASAIEPLQLNRLTSDGAIATFRKDGTTVGSISVTASATSYNTSSDQRLKENITDANEAGDKIDAIQVRQYDWKADGSHQDYGMIAQELMTVAPEAVSGDPESDDMMGVDYSKLVPMLVKEIQSLRARVAQLEN